MIQPKQFYKQEPKLDPCTAWDELALFASLAGSEMDDRAHPDYTPEDDGEEEHKDAFKDEDGEPVESEPADYGTLIKALRHGHAEVDDQGVLTINLVRPVSVPDSKGDPIESLRFDPSAWNFTEAYYALSEEPAVPAVSRAARKRAQASPKSNPIKKLDKSLEILAGLKHGTLRHVCHRHDRDLLNRLGNFCFLG